MNNTTSTDLYYYIEITKIISKTISPFILILCFVGNLLSFLVLINRRLRKQTTACYLAVLCVIEIGTCFTGLLRQFLIDAFKIDIRTMEHFITNPYYRTWTCRIHIYLTYVFLRLSPVLLVIVTMQRYFYVSKKSICTQKSVFIQLFLIITIVCLCESHFFIYYEYTLSDTRPKSELKMECTVDKERYKTYYKFRSEYYGKISLFLFTLLPFVLMVIFNGLLIRTIHQSTKRSQSKKSSKKRNITRMLLTVSLFYTTLTSPASIYIAVAPPKYQLLPWYVIQWTLLRLLFYLCHSVNFLLYCASGSTFRQDFLAMILCHTSSSLQHRHTARHHPQQQQQQQLPSTFSKIACCCLCSKRERTHALIEFSDYLPKERAGDTMINS
ncbi:unnamed protein product [Didymodactylos carnosus]|uniref:G-protein coupled receptors family 1 profile domain-containing protein n=1 Tax=Didymodactylos carnosus TaxID=1234261 RepID=A0A815ZVW0_9BILA|nr:unnamed protein product [Didymodactylos carnosus]CAF1588490.1 unnamed protein product [Didymodactylos carnosus]CAF3686426.1 unnamed protein product [Didymodactylos carnosus]CAF4459542.1 unnamed protein product [Didymodactylos carnosus]